MDTSDLLKILIVDDEKYFRKALQMVINWEELGYTVCGEAENGIEALEKIQGLLPDIILTDINMNKMDGLTFIDNLKQIKPNIKIIVISGYDQFDYAKRALSLGVYNYIVKPVNNDEITQTLIDLKSIIQKERNIHEKIEDFKKTIEINNKILKLHYTNKLLFGNIPHDITQMQKKICEYDMDIGIQPYIVIVIEIDDSYIEKWSLSDKKLWTYATENIVKEILSEKYPCEILVEDTSVIYAILSNVRQYEELYNLLKNICSFIYENLHYSITIAIGELKTKLTQINNSFNEAIFAINNKNIIGENTVICYVDARSKEMLNVFSRIYSKSELIMQMRIGDIEQCNRILDSIYADVIERKISKRLIYVTLLEVLSVCFEYCSENSEEISIDSIEAYNQSFNKIMSIDNVSEMFFETKKIVEELVLKMKTQEHDKVSKIVKKAIDYVIKNFQNTLLSIDLIADNTYTSYGYLCYLFKKDMGKTLNNFITEYRMEKAKILLLQKDKSVSQVAFEVGFSNPNYFSKLFKKAYDVCPSELI